MRTLTLYEPPLSPGAVRDEVARTRAASDAGDWERALRVFQPRPA